MVDTVNVAESQVVGKKWYASKTFWSNAIAAVAILAQIKWGFVVPSEYQMLALTIINAVLRKVTHEPVIW